MSWFFCLKKFVFQRVMFSTSSGAGLDFSNCSLWWCWSCDVGSSLQCRCFLLLISPGVNLPAMCRPHHGHLQIWPSSSSSKLSISLLLWCYFGENDGNLSTINCRWQGSEIESVLVHESPIIGFHPQHPSAGTALEVCWDFNCGYLNSPSVLDEGYDVFLCPAVTMLLALIGIAWWWLRLPTSSTAQWHRKEL